MTTLQTIRGLLMVAMMSGAAVAQTPAPATPPATTTPRGSTSKVQGGAVSRATVNTSAAVITDAKPAVAPRGVLVDQVVGVVNDDLVLESDVDEERRFAAFQPLSGAEGFSREKAIDRLVDRALILQQAKLQPDLVVSDAEVNAQLKELRTEMPACRKAGCETDAGWQKFVQAQGFTLAELTERWRQRMEILKFIEQRFRAGIRVTPEEIKTFYDQTLLPEYKGQKAPPPSLDAVSDRIQEVLLQQHVSSLLGDWLTQLKAEGSVRMMRPDEVAP